MKIKHVYQREDTGCALACIAMILNTTYQQVKDWMIEFGIFEPGTNNWTTSYREIITVLNKKNVRIQGKRKFKQWSNIPAKLAIAATNFDKFGIYHVVVFARDIDGHFIYDPGKRKKKIRDLRGKAAGWFIEINLH